MLFNQDESKQHVYGRCEKMIAIGSTFMASMSEIGTVSGMFWSCSRIFSFAKIPEGPRVCQSWNDSNH